MIDKLAVLGGKPVFPNGPPTWPLPDAEILAALCSTFEDGSWGQYTGRHSDQLVEKLRALHGTTEAYLCSSGTIAVELALRGLLVGGGDEVALAGYDFAGNFRAIESVGARPVLVNIDPGTRCLDPDQLESALSPTTKAVIVSHLHGGLADMPAIMEVAGRHSCSVVEDACQVPGAFLYGRPAGASGDVGVMSFGGSKLLTAGRGGALVTNRAEVIQRIRVYCERGNHACPLSELQAAVLAPQVDKLAERNRVRWESVKRLEIALSSTRLIQFPQWPAAQKSDVLPSFFKLALSLRLDGLRADRAGVLSALQGEGVAIGEGFRGFTQRRKRCRIVGSLPNSTEAAQATMLLHHPVLLESAEVIDELARAFLKVIHHVANG